MKSLAGAFLILGLILAEGAQAASVEKVRCRPTEMRKSENDLLERIRDLQYAAQTAAFGTAPATPVRTLDSFPCSRAEVLAYFSDLIDPSSLANDSTLSDALAAKTCQARDHFLANPSRNAWDDFSDLAFSLLEQVSRSVDAWNQATGKRRSAALTGPDAAENNRRLDQTGYRVTELKLAAARLELGILQSACLRSR